MQRIMKLGLLVIIAGLFTIGTVGAVSEWAIGDYVELIITTTNTGEVNVVESNGMIIVRTEAGTMYDAGFFNVEGVVEPGETVKVSMSWLSSDSPPGYYDIILDGVLIYANGESEDTYTVFEDAFLLYDPDSGLREVPDIITSGYVSGITQISDTYYTEGQFFIIVWVNNTGTTPFFPEIVLDFHNDSYDSGPITEIFVDDPCEPGIEPYMRMCQLPEDMEAGDYQCDVDLNMHYLNAEIDGPQEVEAAYLQTYTCTITDPDLTDTLMYRWIYGDEQFENEDSYCFDLSKYVQDEGDWPPDAEPYEDYCFRWFFDGEQITPDPNDATFCEEVVDPLYTDEQRDFLFEIAETREVPIDLDLYKFTPDEAIIGIDPGEWWWTWEPAFGDEGYHQIEVEVRERTTTDIGASDMLAVFVERKLDQDEPASLYVWMTNDCDYAWEPEFSIRIPVLEVEAPVVTLYGDTIIEDKVPIGTSLHKLQVDVSDIPPSDEGYLFELSVEPVQIFNMELPDDLAEAAGALSYRFLTDIDTPIPDDISFEEALNEQLEAENKWKWTVLDNDWTSVGPHTVYVEVTDDLHNPNYSGEGDRIGVATLEITVTDNTQGQGGGTEPSTSTGEEQGSSTGGTSPTGGTEPSGETPPEEEPEQEPQGFSIQSIIDMIMSFFKNLFG